ncbi:methyl-accepting chemotaxis protein [Allohahella marinimesophila]|uniref:Methyl-accepting chemotaxis protein n=1 Tax=Allohahella marinimesophila TaxID=1054972 RepID=A0ABP7PTW3_9GAMM
MPTLSLRVKTSIPLAIAVAALLLIMVFSSHRTRELEQDMSVFPDRFTPAVSEVLNADRDLYQARVAELRYVYDEADDRAPLRADFEENATQALDRFNSFKDLMAPYPDVLKQLTGFDRVYGEWLAAVKRVLAAMDSGDQEGAITLALGESNAAFTTLRDIYNVAGEAALAHSAVVRGEVAEAVDTSQLISWTVALLITVLVSIIAFTSQTMLLRRIRELNKGIDSIASGGGDLTRKIEVKHHDELGELGLSFNRFVTSLHDLITAVRNDVGQLNRSSDVLNQSAEKASTICSRQSSASDMIVSAVHEMSIATKEMSGLAHQTADETQQAKTFSAQGVILINRSVTQIQALYQSIEGAATGAKTLAEESGKINGFLEVITGIAEQTNLLALNAAIEAARAGEQGRGFAVVADEVRALAGKTQESTNSIRQMIESVQSGVQNVVDMIEDGFGRVSSSVELAKETESLLANTLEVIGRVEEMSIQTATATEEQTAVTDEINRNLQELNAQTQMSNEVAHDTHEAARDVSNMAGSIRDGVGQFKIA